MKVNGAHVASGNVAFANESEDALFELRQFACGFSRAMNATRDVQQIEMHAIGCRIDSIHDEARSKKRKIECFAIERHDEIACFESFANAREHWTLFTELSHEHLFDDESLRCE